MTTGNEEFPEVMIGNMTIYEKIQYGILPEEADPSEHVRMAYSEGVEAGYEQGLENEPVIDYHHVDYNPNDWSN